MLLIETPQQTLELLDARTPQVSPSPLALEQSHGFPSRGRSASTVTAEAVRDETTRTWRVCDACAASPSIARLPYAVSDQIGNHASRRWSSL